jgi:hypothetical protein
MISGRVFALSTAALLSIGLARSALAEPSLRVTPLEMLAGSWQEVQFEFTVGSEEIDPGGGVRIELPVSYLETEPYFWDRPQTNLPDGRGFVSAAVAGGRIDIELSGRRMGIVECVVQDAALGAGDVLTLTYGGVVQSLTWDLDVRAQWRTGPDEEWTNVSNRPVVQFLPHGATTLMGVAPADVVRGEAFDLAVVLLDKFGNRASAYRGEVSFESTDPEATLPASHTFTEQDGGVHVFEGVRFRTPGFQKITVSDGTLEGRFHHSEVHEEEPEFRRFFGDTHFHTGTGTNNKGFTTTSAGGDHRGHFTDQSDAYEHVRDVMRLDFASASEHDTPAFDDHAWTVTRDNADDFNQDGRFTAFYAYEWTPSATEGHHVILYSERDSQIFDHFDYPTKPAIYRALDLQQRPAVMIPHVMWAQPDHGIWEVVSNEYRTVGEFYSLWNNRFLLQPGDEPQRFELGIENPWSYQYAWHHGHEIGVVGSTDNHTGHPGANNWTAHTQHTGGLAATWARENTRPGIWDALRERRTYATTGVRILLEFTADGRRMGERYSTAELPTLSVSAAGTNTIESVEIVKYDGESYTAVHTVRPEAETCSFQFRDDGFHGDSMYYVRVSQVDELWRSPWSHTTREMAWSSPIWIDTE